MGFWNALGSIVGNAAGGKAMQAGSDVMIQRHTIVDPLAVPSHWRAQANEAIKQRFTAPTFDQGAVTNEMEAALLKLAMYHAFAESEESGEALAALGHSLTQLRDAAEPKQINAGLSLEVMGLTGR